MKKMCMIFSKCLLFTVLFLAGCAPLVKSMPTYEYCDHVKYERTGTKAVIQAECEMPRGNAVLGL